VPVLIHPQPKPGCAKDIINYFTGDLELHSLSDRRQFKLLDRRVEREIETAVEEDFTDKVKAGETLLGRPRGSSVTRSIDWKGKGKAREVEVDTNSPDEPLRILVVGDRLATDVLLARRLSKHLGNDPSQSLEALPPAVSIITTDLFKYRDVRLLRWLESRWSRIGRRSTAVERGRRAGWETFLLARSLEARDAATGDLVVEIGPSRLRRFFLFLRGIPSGISRLRRWRPPTIQQILYQTRQALLRGIKQAVPVVARGLRRGAGVVTAQARGVLQARRSRLPSTTTALGQRRQFGTLGGRRLNAKRDLSMTPLPESQPRPDRSYEQFPDDLDYTQFSASLDRVPMKGPRSVMVDHLESLGDKEIASVLEEVLTVRAENPHMEHWDMGLISVMLSIRSRSTYDEVLRSISPAHMTSLITSLLSMGAIHLSQLILHDIAIRPKISDDVKMAVLKGCSTDSQAVQALDRSYLTRLVADVDDQQLGLVANGSAEQQTGLVVQDADNHVARLRALLEGYLLEREGAKSDASRIHKTLYTYIAENIGLGLPNTLPDRERERQAKWLVYRVVASLLERNEVIHALKICKLLGQAGWFDLTIFSNRQTGGQLFTESTGLLVWCGIIRACNDLQWIDRAWSLVPAARKIGSKLAGTDNVALGPWSETIDLIIISASASRITSHLRLVESLLLGAPLRQAGLTLSHSALDGFYNTLERVHISTVWSVYRKLRTQGYPPPRDTCLLELHAFLAESHRTQLSIETLIKDVEANPGTLSPTYLPHFIVYLARSRSHESARRFYENAVNNGTLEVKEKVLQNPYVMYALVRAFGAAQTTTNARSYDRAFAQAVIRTFIASSPPIPDLAPSSVGLLARSFVLVGASESADKLLEHTFPTSTSEPSSSSLTSGPNAGTLAGTVPTPKPISTARDKLVNALVKGDAEALPVFTNYIARHDIRLSSRHREMLKRGLGGRRKAIHKAESGRVGSADRAVDL